MAKYKVDYDYTEDDYEFLDYPQIKIKKKQKFEDDDMVHSVKNSKNKKGNYRKKNF